MTTDLPQSRSQAPARHVRKTSHTRSGPVRSPKNRLGAFGLILALTGLTLALVPLAGFDTLLVLATGIVVSALGMVLSIASLWTVSKTTGGTTGISYAGITLSVVAAAGCVTWLLQTGMNSGTAGLHFPAVSGDRHTVEFVVTSTGGAAVRYGNMGEQRTDRTLASTDAWRQRASYNRGPYLVTLTADNTSASLSNTITCGLFVDGTKVSENSGPTIALCTANVG